MATESAFWSKLAEQNNPKSRIAFTDATDPRVLRSIHEIINRKIAHPILIGDPKEIIQICRENSIPLPDQKYIYPVLSAEQKARLKTILIDRQKKISLTENGAEDQLKDALYVGLALLVDQQVDGVIGGSLRPTGDVVRAALHLVGPKAGQKLISGQFLIESHDRITADNTPFLFADCAVMPEPSSRALAMIAASAAASYRFFTGKAPKVALLSFSTRGSAEHPLVDRIRDAVKIIQENDPGLVVDGELQVDAALDRYVAAIKKAQDSPVAGQANVFIFPTLEAGNLGYKLVQRFSKARVAGPLLWGLAKPVSDLSRGCTVEEITDTALVVSTMIRSLN